MNELSNWDEETILAMLQAITVYILKIFDGDPFSVNFDRELVGAMTVSYLRSLHNTRNS
jgi:hypothetical protein